MRIAHLDPLGTRAGVQPGISLDAMMSDVALRGANTLVSDPGSPYCELAGAAQADLFNRWAPDGGGSAWRMIDQGTPYAHTAYMPAALLDDPAFSGGSLFYWAVTLGSLSLLVLTEGLLHFRVAAAVSPVAQRCAAPFVIGAHIGRRRLAAAAFQILLRLLLLISTQVVLIGLPMALIPRVIANFAQFTIISWVQPMCLTLTMVSLAFINALITAFATVFDARLYMAMQRA
jgi:hypothetical protein